jgi:putative transcriptional regulator
MRSGLLLASPQMEDVHFAGTVILLCDYTEDGAVGVIVNRVTDVGRDEVLGQMDIEDGEGIRQEVRWGGPVQPGAVFLTFAEQDLPMETQSVDSLEIDEEPEAEPTFHVDGGLRVTPSRPIIEAVAAKADNPGAFLTLGYAGWAPGQLDKEIQEGSWIPMEIDSDTLFATDPEEAYDVFMARLGIEPSALWMHPINE